MKFNTAIPGEAKEAAGYFKKLYEKKNVVEVKKVSPNRSLNQNAYLHLLIGAFAQHFGYTADEAKTIYKREVNPNLYVYEKNGAKFLRHSSDLSKEDMAKSIDRFMQYSAEAGYPLPLATNQEWLRQIDNEIERSKYYL